ncbi:MULTISPECIES: replication endonuclease [unclassified Gilliamella]|uniref:replication endonuclease n=1 Tax=unclassified Gilliamella TaxID=2685620 RepID=UPI00226A8D0E|nr:MULTISPECIES: replication endonuclease [unclassified Gilliamella]MCX8587279.1 replication endonuclease [Gilliamella sp. B3801]MCX8591966.1 replication endonuclease [Gilliamella sp. B3804]
MAFSIIQRLPPISDRARYALSVVMRDYYDRVGQFLPSKFIQPKSPRNTERRAPADLSIIERPLWEQMPHEYRYFHHFFSDTPQFIGSYFARKYATLYQEKGSKTANTYLRTCGLTRCSEVQEKYTIKNTGTSLVAQAFYKQLSTLPTYDKIDVDELGAKIAGYMQNLIIKFLETDEFKLSNVDHELKLYKFALEQIKPLKITAPYFADYKKGEIAEQQIVIALAKLSDDKWWQNKLKRMWAFQREHLAIAAGQVQKFASPYASRTCVGEWREQKRKNREWLKNQCIENTETGEQFELVLQVDKSNANPAIRRCELMIRMRGFEDIADEFGYCGAFITITAPSKFHAVHAKGGFIKNWNAGTPRDTQKYLCNVWAKIRAKLNREHIKIFGFRVAEPHHDGTPHWHILAFMLPEHVGQVHEIMRTYALDEDGDEPGAQENRFKFVDIDKQRGSATGYIAKYISKNIDGYQLADEVDDETGQNLRDMAKNVSAWASRWGIRQFQQIGGAPVTVWRELRRLGSQKVDNPEIDPVLAAADAGDWAAYTQLQGGAMVQRNNLRVRISYEEEQNQFEEEVKKIKGVFSPIVGIASFICTRLIKWAIVSKNRRERAPRSSVNNYTACTVVKTSPLDDQREAIKKQLRIIGLPDDDFTVNRLFFRRSIQINRDQYLKLDNTLDGVHLIFSNSPSVPRKPQKQDIVLFDF